MSRTMSAGPKSSAAAAPPIMPPRSPAGGSSHAQSTPFPSVSGAACSTVPSRRLAEMSARGSMSLICAGLSSARPVTCCTASTSARIIAAALGCHHAGSSDTMKSIAAGERRSAASQPTHGPSSAGSGARSGAAPRARRARSSRRCMAAGSVRSRYQSTGAAPAAGAGSGTASCAKASP